MFIPTEDELERNKMMNEAARKHQEKKRQTTVLKKQEIIQQITQSLNELEEY